MSRLVTLITGDQVIVAGDGRTATFAPGRKRPGVLYMTTEVDGHLNVVPTDAARLIAVGKVDRRLFDLTTLIQAGYDDSRSAQIPLLVTGTVPTALKGAHKEGSRTTGAISKARAAEVWKALTADNGGATKIWLDGAQARVETQSTEAGQIETDPTELSFGVQQWPHDDDLPVVKSLTYRNNGADTVELRLSAALNGPDGEPAPAGAISLSTQTLTVPAGGSASVDVTVNTRHDGLDGVYYGEVVAEFGDQAVQTAVSIEKEVESYTLTVRSLAPAGESAAGAVVSVSGLEKRAEVSGSGGVIQLRAPRGKYFLLGIIPVGVGEAKVHHILIQPTVDISTDTALVLDARQTKAFDITLENKSVRSFRTMLSYARRLGTGPQLSGTIIGDDPKGIAVAQIGPDLPTTELRSALTTHWAIPGAAGDFSDSPVRYGVLDARDGGIISGLHRTVRDEDLAKVVARHGEHIPGSRLVRGFTAAPDGWPSGGRFGVPLMLTRPLTVTEYLEGGAVSWGANIWDIQETEFGSRVVSEQYWPSTREFTSGSVQTEDWNYAVFGPALLAGHIAQRYGDTVVPAIPLFTDRGPHVGQVEYDWAQTRLHRDGVLIAESNLAGSLGRGATVEPGRSRFRLETKAERGYTPWTRKIHVAWTFSSDTAPAEGAPLSLWVMRFQPVVGPDNRAEAGPVTRLPFTVTSMPGSIVGRLGIPKVQVSGDEGKTWQSAAVASSGSRRYVAVFATPPGATALSLRATATDSDGNAVEQTVIGAFGLR